MHLSLWAACPHPDVRLRVHAIMCAGELGTLSATDEIRTINRVHRRWIRGSRLFAHHDSQLRPLGGRLGIVVGLPCGSGSPRLRRLKVASSMALRPSRPPLRFLLRRPQCGLPRSVGFLHPVGDVGDLDQLWSDLGTLESCLADGRLAPRWDSFRGFHTS